MALVCYCLLLAWHSVVFAAVVARLLMKPETTAAIENVKRLADLVKEARETARCAAVVGRPEGAVTIQEYADGPPAIGRSTATDQLKKAITAGLMEKIYAVVAGTDGKPRRTQFFRKVKR